LEGVDAELLQQGWSHGATVPHIRTSERQKMKKSALIEALTAIPGDPVVCVYEDSAYWPIKPIDHIMDAAEIAASNQPLMDEHEGAHIIALSGYIALTGHKEPK
jgi:hypothetical protein